MSNEKLQRYFNSIVKIISDTCTKSVKKQLCVLNEINFKRFYSKLNQLSDTDSPTLYNLVQLFYLNEDLKKIVHQSEELTSIFSQKFNNSEIFFNTIFNVTPDIKMYIEILKKLHSFEETVNMDILISLGNAFRITIVNFQNLQNPSLGLIREFTDTLKKYRTSPELKTSFDPIIELAAPNSLDSSHTTPVTTPSIRSATTPSQ